MHPALLIDEILQLILEVVLDDRKSSLCCVARCCQAWKDPALDRIWRRLPSAVPLFSLLPGFSLENGTVRLLPATQDVALKAFHSYAVRVRHIVHRHRVLADSSVPMDLSHHLNNLESARIESSAHGEVAVCMGLAPRLRTLVLQSSYTKSHLTLTPLHSIVSLLEKFTSLEQLSVRGYSSECLHIPLSRIATLRSLTLHLSSITVQSFMTVAKFPLLVDLDVHADCLAFDHLSSAITQNTSCFPALEKLKIRAQPALVALILGQLPRHMLRFLHVDATSPGSSSASVSLFNGASTFPLHEFILEHTSSTDESEDVPAYASDKFFTLDHLRPLSKLPLRCLVLDSPLPPDLSDQDTEEMTRWWPLLERLELGACTALENVEMTWNPRNSLASLYTLARGCQRLKSLGITLDADAPALSGQTLVPPACHALVSLSISSRSRPDVSSFSAMLSRLFPSLGNVTLGFVGEHEDAWTAVQGIVERRI